MPQPIDGLERVRPLKSWGGAPFIMACNFSTDGSGVPTMGTGADYGGAVTVAQATNTYTLTLGCTWSRTRAIHVTHGLAATVNYTLTVDAAAGTIAIAFSGAIASNRVDVTLYCDASPIG